ncbi:GPW/gp25 family protein [Nocardioides sp. zg-1230]|uniref:GPW/gp25 family protein n=1 Tax=Nocardioides sp. zg-1230 TaxID=2736601 RepID=UPI0015534AEF|nr:GPW/gp25 family protein [Nocardioides sp. zg-1230]NPC44590.1 GPW/gp25 family protein [Nocardioides sp. zg-1230]
MARNDLATSAPGSPADQWLGTGLRMPLLPQDGRIAWVDGMELVRQSIETILETEPGERIMLPGFGCGLRRYLMAPNTVSTRAAIQQDVEAALSTWEPRIRLVEVSVTPGARPTMVWIGISYVRVSDLRADNLVYPFYLE